MCGFLFLFNYVSLLLIQIFNHETNACYSNAESYDILTGSIYILSILNNIKIMFGVLVIPGILGAVKMFVHLEY